MKSETQKTEAEAKPADKVEAEPTALEKALSEAVDGEADGLEALPEADRPRAVALRRLAKGLDAKAVLGLAETPAPVVKTDVDPLADLPPEAKAKVEGLFKAQAEAIAKAEALTKELAAAKEEKEVTEAIAKAAKDFPNVPEKADKLGPALRTLAKADSKAYAVLEDVLKKLNAVAAKVLEPLGKSDPTGEAGKSAEEKVIAMAADRVAKSAGKIAYATAYDQILVENKDLYTAIEAEKRASAKGN